MNKINPDENRDYLFYDLGSGAPTAISHRCPSWPWGGFIRRSWCSNNCCWATFWINIHHRLLNRFLIYYRSSLLRLSVLCWFWIQWCSTRHFTTMTRLDHVVDSFLLPFVLLLERFVVFVVVQVALADLDYQRAVLTKLPPRKCWVGCCVLRWFYFFVFFTRNK